MAALEYGGPVPSISEILHKAINERVFPGAAVAYGDCGEMCFSHGYGTYTFESNLKASEQSLWDVASLTKIMVTVPAIMILYERDLIELDAPAARYLPAFGQHKKGHVTVRQLLTHTAGLREFYPFYDMGLTTREQIRKFILADKCWYPPGTTKYSDLSMIVLGWIVEEITGQPLEAFVKKELHQPLGMHDTHFRPVGETDFDIRVIPTEVDQGFRKRLLWGEVHDPTAYLLGGVAGHAGLFSTAKDIARYARMLLAGGVDPASGRRFFEESTLRLFTRQQPPTELSPRPFALGFDTTTRRALDNYTSGGSFLGRRAFGHTGFTGTSLWIDPERNVFVALLTNAVHPSAGSLSGAKIREVRPAVADAAVLTLEALPFQRARLMWYDLALPERGAEMGAESDPQPAGLMASFAAGPSVVELPESSPRGGETPAPVDFLSVGAFARVGSAMQNVRGVPVTRLGERTEAHCSVNDGLNAVSIGSSREPADQEVLPSHSDLDSSLLSRNHSSAASRDSPSVAGQSGADVIQSFTVETSRTISQSDAAIHSRLRKGVEKKVSRSGVSLMGVMARHVASAAVVGMAIKIIC
ncbi:beta-lactamase [Klebsormidium nitens]|uniref:Beta-lactamase n=1 Tax=Klebsormidium nitens TaxID=105231 RepID=A0A1Y1IB23_KLENI|nr:beta-lactamase [Klebsormidium nitens]|eukprot:GAQ85896.1 beta-lactamase [Klebsormidium nitens]